MSRCRCDDRRILSGRIEMLRSKQQELLNLDNALYELSELMVVLGQNCVEAFESTSMSEIKADMLLLDENMSAAKQAFYQKIDNKMAELRKELQAVISEDEQFHEEEQLNMQIEANSGQEC